MLNASIIMTVIIALMMEAGSTPQTSVKFYRSIPGGSDRHTRRRQNLKSHLRVVLLCKYRLCTWPISRPGISTKYLLDSKIQDKF
jgi:hypothetical protein